MERPILFAAPMVRAILDGRKTQTRRVVKLPADASQVAYWAPPSGRSQPGWADPGVNYWTDRGNHLDPCPYGQPGDRIWVRETWCSHATDTAEEDAATNAVWDKFAAGGYSDIVAASNDLPKSTGPLKYLYAADFEAAPAVKRELGPWRPSIHMPRVACRILLEITEVRVQRLQEISQQDARAEGVLYVPGHGEITPDELEADPGYSNFLDCRLGFWALWDSINGKRAGADWQSNPWVWAITFKRTAAN